MACKPRTVWCAVRRSLDGDEWCDVKNGVGGTEGDARVEADKIDRDLPGYALRHPVIRIAQIVIVEVGEHNVDHVLSMLKCDACGKPLANHPQRNGIYTH